MADSGRGSAPRQGGRPQGGRPQTGRRGQSDRGAKPYAGGRSGGPGGRRPTQEQRTADQIKYDGPDLPDEITGKELDRNVLAQLRGLPEKLALRVARHLVAAGQLLDSDPEAAYQHALAARARAQRVAVIREATGEAAYAAGHFTEALAELRAAKRMNGAIDYLPVMADCERALGRPERALALAKNPSVGEARHRAADRDDDRRGRRPVRPR